MNDRKLVRWLLLLLLFPLFLGYCSEERFRYPCQDPANWDAKECNPPICEPSGTCSKDLVGKAVWDEYQNSKVKNG